MRLFLKKNAIETVDYNELFDGDKVASKVLDLDFKTLMNVMIEMQQALITQPNEQDNYN